MLPQRHFQFTLWLVLVCGEGPDSCAKTTYQHGVVSSRYMLKTDQKLTAR